MLHVILVSPKAHERKIIKDYFARLEYDVFIPGEEIHLAEVESAQEAIDLITSMHAQKNPFELVICSDKLPDSSGADLALKISANPNVAWTPFILYSREMTTGLAEEVKKAGVKEVIMLPFSMESFRDTLTRIVDEKIAQTDLTRREKLRDVFEKDSNVEVEERLRLIYSSSLTDIYDAQMLAPWSLNVRLSKAKIYCGQNDFKAALPLLKTIVSHDPNDKMTQELLMLCYKRLGKVYEDTGDLELLVQQNPGSSTLNQRYGEIMLAEGHNEDAIIFFRKAIDLYKKTIVAKIKALKNKGGADAGEMKEELTMHSGLVSTYFNLITAYKKVGNEKLVKEVLEEVYKISPQTSADWFSMFQTYLSGGDYAKAKYSLNKALADKNRNQEFLQAAAESYIRQGNYEEALELFEKLIRLHPSDVRIYNFIGICSRHLNKHLSALEAYKKALAIDPSDASIHFNKGCTLEDMNHLDKALESFGEAVKLDPSLKIASMAIERVKNKTNIKGEEK